MTTPVTSVTNYNKISFTAVTINDLDNTAREKGHGMWNMTGGRVRESVV